METKKIVILISGEEYDFYENILAHGKTIEGCDEDGVAITWTANFGNGIEADIKVCNAPEDAGGAYIDPVLFENGQEIRVGEVGDSLSATYEFEFEDVNYKVALLRDN